MRGVSGGYCLKAARLLLLTLALTLTSCVCGAAQKVSCSGRTLRLDDGSLISSYQAAAAWDWTRIGRRLHAPDDERRVKAHLELMLCQMLPELLVLRSQAELSARASLHELEDLIGAHLHQGLGRLPVVVGMVRVQLDFDAPAP